MKLTDRVAIVTGGGTGIGQETAIALAGEGAKVIVFGRRPEPLEETVALIKKAGGEAKAVPGDVTSAEDIGRLRDAAESLYGRLDVLVNNAGTGMVKPFMGTTPEDFDLVYQVDLRSVFTVTQAMVPLLKKNAKGSVINISSILGVLGAYNSAAYCAAKGGVNNLTRAMAADLGPEIRVNCICPSHVETPMMQGPLDALRSKNKMDRLTRLFPLKRIATAGEIAGIVVFYASDDSSWLTGTVLLADGGLSCYV